MILHFRRSIFLTLTAIFSFNLWAQLAPPPEEVFRYEVIEFRPQKDHHFELNASQECSNAQVVEKSKDLIKCQFLEVGPSSLELNVCDDKKTFCKTNKFTLNVKELPSGIKAQPLRPGLVEMKEEIHQELLPGFESLGIEEAKRKAKEMNLPVLLMVSTDWCPPCNQSKEYLLSTPQFKDFSSYVLKVYVDGDSKESAEFDKEVPFFEFPSFILLNKDFKEVSRFRHELAFFEYRAWWNRAAPYIPYGYEEARKWVVERKLGSWWRKFLDFVFIVFDYDRTRDLHFVLENALAKKDQDFLKMTSIDDVPDYLMEEWLTSQEERLVPAVMTKAELRRKAMGAAGLSPSYVSFVEDACAEKQEPECSEGLISLKERPSKIMARPERSEAENWATLADEYYAQMYLFKKQSDRNSMVRAAKSCVEAFEKLLGFSALKFPRYAFQGMSACAKEYDPKKVDGIFLSLIKQYPDDPTFIMRYARFLKDETKNLDRAKVWALKAMEASYDFNWFSSASIYIQICKALGQKQDALKVVREAFSRLQLSKNENSRDQKVLSRFRELERELVAN